MIRKGKIAGAFLLFLTACTCFGQTSYKVTNYTSRDGLSNSSVYDIAKDSSGFLWIATELGINKFDGQKFYTYTPNSHNLPDNSVTNIAVIGNDRLFCATGTSGYFIFDSKQEKVMPLPGNFASFLYKSHHTKFVQGRVYIKSSSGNQVLVYDLQKSRITDTIDPGRLQILSFDVVEGGNIVLITNEGLKIWKNGTISDYRVKGLDASAGTIRSFFYAPSFIYFTRNGYLCIYDKFTGRVQDSVKYSSSDIAPNKLLVDKEGNIWFSTYFPAGIYRYNPVSKELLNFTSHLKGVETSIGSLMEDDERNIWVGTYSSGLYKISPSLFNQLPAMESENVYYAQFNGADELFLGTKTGLNRLNRKTNTVENITIDAGDNRYIYSVVKAGAKYMVLNSNEDGIKYAADKTPFRFLRRRSMCLLSDTLAVMGAWSNMLELVSLRADTFCIRKTLHLQSADGARNRINCFLLDSRHLLWCGTDAGLYVLSPDLEHCAKIGGQLSKNRITDLLEQDGCMYIATQKGLVRYSKGKLSLTREISNHPIDKINSLCRDRHGSVFLGTLNGLFRINNKGMDAYFDEDDGLVSKEINKLAYNEASNSLLIATNEGICEFNLNQFKYMMRSVPKLHLDRITSTGDIACEDGVYSIYKKRNVNLYFGSICFSHASAITYKWRADGNAFHYIYNPSIELAAVAYGRHMIEIYASNDGTSWSQPLLIELNVETPFYETIWFYLLATLLLIFLLGLVLRFWVARIRRKANVKSELEQKLVQLKFEALNAAINPHFIFNALNSVQHYININHNDEASDYLAKFGFLIRQTIENATQHFISIHDEIERLKMYMDLERVRFNNGFTYEIKVDPSLNIFKDRIPNMILQPLIENSIVHGFKQIEYTGAIHLHFLKAESGLLVVLEDNGRGLRKPAHTYLEDDKKKSIGLENVKERVRTIPGASLKIYDKSFVPGRGNGVLVEIALPPGFSSR